MTFGFSLFVVALLIAIPALGAAAGGHAFWGVVIPYAALAIFLAGFTARILGWARVPVPFRIPTAGGQQKSLDWIKSSRLDNPHSAWGTIGRMALEILCFRSLFRNTRVELREGPKLAYGSSKWLWAAALAFHYAFLVVFLRHFKYFVEPTPAWVTAIQGLDGFFQVGLPVLYVTDALLLGAVAFLLGRRLLDARVRYISHAADYFPLLLIAAIAVTGVLMRYFFKVDLLGVKQLAVGLLSLQPVVPEGVGAMFFVHLFLVSSLIVYLPFSKLMHLGGVFLSPTRNLPNDNRMRRHVNPWNYPVKVHTYEEYEEEFHEVMKAAGLPLDKEKSCPKAS
ncbi:MAG: menaquinol oxidoreductase [Candidatus Zixiibacteriota bacterium]|nr:MAG: menaquinol oxidoreductase [candidate division Zixibacteria bacterium]